MKNRIESIVQEQINLQMKQLTLEDRLKQLKKLLSNKQDYNENKWILPATVSDVYISSLRKSIDKLQLEEARLAHAYLPSHYKLKNIRSQITDLQTMLQIQKYRLQQSLYKETLEQQDSTEGL